MRQKLTSCGEQVQLHDARPGDAQLVSTMFAEIQACRKGIWQTKMNRHPHRHLLFIYFRIKLLEKGDNTDGFLLTSQYARNLSIVP